MSECAQCGSKEVQDSSCKRWYSSTSFDFSETVRLCSDDCLFTWTKRRNGAIEMIEYVRTAAQFAPSTSFTISTEQLKEAVEGIDRELAERAVTVERIGGTTIIRSVHDL